MASFSFGLEFERLKVTPDSLKLSFEKLVGVGKDVLSSV